MSPLQSRFVQEYLVDLNGTQAAIRAGYSAASAKGKACTLLNDPAISEAITAAAAKRAEQVGIDAAYVLRQAVKLHERCMQEVSPITDRKGDPVKDEAGNPLFEFDAMGASKALELVGKHVFVQAFKDKVEHSGAMVLNVSQDDAAL